MSGSVSYHAGLTAEHGVARDYLNRGFRLRAERYRGRAGEIDLIVHDGAQVVFVEVKKSKSHSGAAARLSQRQINRIFRSASEFLAGEPNGQDTDARFDVALVDQSGQIEILENALSA